MAIPFVLLLPVTGCSDQQVQVPVDNTSDSLTLSENDKQADHSTYYTTKDTVVIPTEVGDTTTYSRAEFNQIIDEHAELVTDDIQDPYQTYYSNRKGFDSEVGQDGYFVLYAYFLKQKNSIEPYADRRNKLIDIFSNINAVFGAFQYGGTYFGHQEYRILGYAEYAVYLYKEMRGDQEKTYDITRQKSLYIQSLRQLISDENKIDQETTGTEKMNRAKQLNAIVDKIDKSITDLFYLRKAQEFQYVHYQYY